MIELHPIRRVSGYVWTYFACPDCGDIFSLPKMEGDETPWCIHHNEYSWVGPSSPESEWTKTVPAHVFIAPTDAMLTPEAARRINGELDKQIIG